MKHSGSYFNSVLVLASLISIVMGCADDKEGQPPIVPPPVATPPAEVSTEYDERPRLLKQVFTRYPEAARRAEKGGLVKLEFIVGVDGRATGIKVVKEEPKGFGFGEASIEAVKKMRFSPARKDGETVPVRVRLPIRFTHEL